MCFYSIFFFLNDTPPPNIPPPPPHPALPLSGEPAARRGAGARPARRKREQIRQVRLRVGMVFQQFNLFPHMTAIENVMSGPLAEGVKGDDKAAVRRRSLELLDQVGLADKADQHPIQIGRASCRERV